MNEPTLYGMAEALLSVAEECLVGLNLAVPARKVIYMGTIPADCEQLAVVFGSWAPYPPLEGMTVCANYRWAGAFTVLITRGCVPIVGMSGNPPTAESMSTVAGIASDDAEALLAVVARIGEHGGDVSIACNAPAGGLHSTVLQLDLPAGEI